MSNSEFSHSATINLCLPSTACMDRVGEVIKGQVVVEMHGDNIQSTSLPGDHWRKRHDQMKLLIYRLCMWSGLPADMEVFNLFSRYISQEGLARIHSHRQGLNPDLRIAIQVGDQPRPVLHELKVFNCSQSRYKPSWRDRAVDRRAEALHQEYVDKARRVDSQYGGTAPGTVGPVEEKLLSFERVQSLGLLERLPAESGWQVPSMAGKVL